MSAAQTPDLLWQPSQERIANTRLSSFMDHLKRQYGVEARDYHELWDWSRASRENVETFWSAVWDFCGVVAETRGERVTADFEKMPGAAFFPDAKLNFAENLLQQQGRGDAIVFWGEDQVQTRLSHDALYQRVSKVAQGLKEQGVGPGDRVAAYLPNMPETMIVMLATASLGAIFSSCSPDFGPQGVLDRFGQIEPKVLFAVDAYHYNGKVRPSAPNVAEVVKQLPTVQKTLLVHYAGDGDPSGIDNAERMDAWEDRFPGGPIDFVQMPFNSPLYILFSSGTTGKPKCIVHGAGGTLLQHLKEHKLHADVKPGDRVFYTITATNTGVVDLSDVVVQMILPTGINRFAGTWDVMGTTLNCSSWCDAGEIASWTLGTLAPGESRQIVMKTQIGAGATPGRVLRSQLQAWSSSTRHLTAAQDVAVDPTPLLTLNLMPDTGPAVAGEPFTYTLTAGNVGAATPTDVELRMPVPDGTSFVSATGGGVLDGAAVIWDIGALGTGASRELQMVVQPEASLDSGDLLEAEGVSEAGRDQATWRAESWLQRQEPAFRTAIEAVFDEFSTPLRVVARASNGEAFYERAD